MLIFRIEKDWYSLMKKIQTGKPAEVDTARQELRDGLVTLEPVFADQPYFMSTDFSLVDCCIAPLLWRLPSLGIELPRQAKALKKYMQRVFERDSFQASLTEAEHEMHEPVGVLGEIK